MDEILRIRQPRLERKLGPIRPARVRIDPSLRQQRRLHLHPNLPKRNQHLGGEENPQHPRHRLQRRQLGPGHNPRSRLRKHSSANALQTARLRRLRQPSENLEGRRR